MRKWGSEALTVSPSHFLRKFLLERLDFFLRSQYADFQFKSNYFDYDNVKLVEVDPQGALINDEVDAGSI